MYRLLLLLLVLPLSASISLERSRQADEEYAREHPSPWWHDFVEALFGIIISGPGIDIVPIPKPVVKIPMIPRPARVPEPVPAPRAPAPRAPAPRAPAPRVPAPRAAVLPTVNGNRDVALERAIERLTIKPSRTTEENIELMRLVKLNEVSRYHMDYWFFPINPYFSNRRFRLKWPILKHILERHVPEYLNPALKSQPGESQTLFPPNTRYDNVIRYITDAVENNTFKILYAEQKDSSLTSNLYVKELNNVMRIRVQEAEDIEPFTGKKWFDIVQIYPRF